jgi:Mce-associated membrane protein
MTESNDSEQQSGGRLRRRAVRQSGPPVEGTTGAVEPAPIESVKHSRHEAAPATSAVADAPAAAPRSADTAPSEPVAEPGDSGSGRRGLQFAGMIAAIVVLFALLGATGWLVYEKQQADALDAKRNEFIEAAKTSATNLTSIHVDTAKDDVQRILDNATGEFREEFDGRVDPFVSVVTEAKVNTDGEVLEAGLENEAGDTGTVLVAVRSMVTNAGSDKPQSRDFRLRITVVDENDRMMTSKVEFVA